MGSRAGPGPGREGNDTGTGGPAAWASPWVSPSGILGLWLWEGSGEGVQVWAMVGLCGRSYPVKPRL